MPESFGVFPRGRHLRDAGLHSGFVFAVGDAKPARLGRKHFAAGLVAAYKLPDGKRNVALAFHLSSLRFQEFLKEAADLFEEVW